MNVGELFVKLGVKADTKTLREFGQKLNDLPVDAALAIAGLAGVSFELKHIAQEAMNAAVGFQLFTNQTGLSWQELQKWQIAASQANVSVEAVTTSVSALQRNMAEIRLGRGNIAPYQMLGINPNQDAFHVLEQLRQRIKGVDPSTATNIVSQMGINPEMMNLLKLSDKQFGEFFNHIHGMTERQEKDFLDAKLALTQWREEFQFAMFGVVSDFTEAIEKSAEFKKALIGIGIVLGVIAVETFPVTAAMGALLLVLDDLAVYFTGGKSLTGNAIEGLKDLSFNLKNLIATLPEVQKLEHWADVLERIAAAAIKMSESFGATALSGLSVMAGGAIAAQGYSDNNKVHTNIANVNVSVQGGPLDAAGWQDIAHNIKRSVEAAHLQLNN